MAVLGSTVVNGNLTVNGSITGKNIYATSDKNLKENINIPDINFLDIINNIQIKEFNFIDDPNKQKYLGCIAQELQEVLPEEYKNSIVVENNNLMVNEGKLVFILIGALKELTAKNAENEAKIKELENKCIIHE